MEVKIKTNWSDLFKVINEDQPKDQTYFDTLEFLEQNNWKTVFVHGKVDEYTIEASRYENWKRFNVPADCFDVWEDQPNEETESKLHLAMNFLKERPKDIAITVTIIIVLILLYWAHLVKVESDKPKPKQKTAIEILSEKQSHNIDKIGANMETQKILKSQIKDLQDKLDQKISEVKSIELENSTIREQMIEETAK